jgi:hypothetical protein
VTEKAAKPKYNNPKPSLPAGFAKGGPPHLYSEKWTSKRSKSKKGLSILKIEK